MFNLPIDEPMEYRELVNESEIDDNAKCVGCAGRFTDVPELHDHVYDAVMSGALEHWYCDDVEPRADIVESRDAMAESQARRDEVLNKLGQVTGLDPSEIAEALRGL